MPARNHDDDDEAVTFGMPGRGSGGGGGGGARFDTRVFDASCQQLTSLPPALHAGELSGVRELTLAFNALTSLEGLPQACPCLERLNASHNQLESLPNLSPLPRDEVPVLVGRLNDPDPVIVNIQTPSDQGDGSL